MAHEDLTAHLDDPGDGRLVCAHQAQRDVPDRAQVGRYVLPGDAVSARGPPLQKSVTVGEGDSQAVDLRFGDECELRPGKDSIQPRGPGIELFSTVDVAQREHRQRVPNLTESPLRRRADT